MAGESSVRPDWTPVASRIRDEATDNWDDRVAVERFEAKGGRFVRGRARLTGPGTVEVDGRTVTARRGLVVATGTKPSVPPIPGLADVDYWTNREAIETTTVPRSLVVLGGGAIGAELAQVFARFGSNVTVVEALDRLLPPEEPEASELIAAVFARQGLTVRTGKRAENVVQSGGRIIITLSDGDCVEGDKVLVATGRHVDLGTLGLSAIGVDPQARAIPVDGHMRVAPGVWAVGDVTGVGAFTHVAMYQAHVAVADILGKDHAPADYRALPRVTFTDPEVGSVGITELAARESGLPVRTGQAALPSSARGWIHKAGNDGLIKLVADTKRDVLVGATSIGPAGGEVLGLLALAVHAQVPVPVLRQMIFAYPTFHRAVEAALEDLAA
jgi:pyruvate/2-oxoglutarate dehydrogenase complex dihydrolipoamide dehydrogenase (E3) component